MTGFAVTGAAVVRQAAALALLAGTFFAAGRRTVRRLAFTNAWEAIAVSLALGAGICGTAAFLLALAGGLNRTGILVAAAVIHAVALPVWIDLARGIRRASLRDAAATAAPLILVLPSFLYGLYPSSGFDATLYHLPIARALATSHSVDFLTNLRNPVFPELVESLDASMLVLFGDAATHLVECTALFAVACALAGFARRRNRASSGLIAAAFWLAHPMIFPLGGDAYVDLDLTLFAVVAYFAFESWRESDDGRWLCIAGALAGFAAATKYTGLAVLPVLIVLTLWRRKPARLRSVAVLSAFGVAFLLPTYVWIFAATGNPVFPYFPAIFGHSAWEKGEVLLPRVPLEWSARGYLGRSVMNAWRGRIGVPGDVFSPLWAVELALALAAAVREPRARRALGIALACGVPLLVADPRFVLPSLALVAFAAAIGLEGLRTPDARPRALGGLLAILLAALAVWPALSHAQSDLKSLGAVPATGEERSGYLGRRLSGYPAIEWMNRRYGTRYSLYFLRGENLAYFADGNFMGDWRGPFRFERVMDILRRPRRLSRVLHAFGAEFFAMDRTTAALVASREFDRRFNEVYRDAHWTVWRIVDVR